MENITRYLKSVYEEKRLAFINDNSKGKEREMVGAYEEYVKNIKGTVSNNAAYNMFRTKEETVTESPCLLQQHIITLEANVWSKMIRGSDGEGEKALIW